MAPTSLTLLWFKSSSRDGLETYAHFSLFLLTVLPTYLCCCFPPPVEVVQCEGQGAAPSVAVVEVSGSGNARAFLQRQKEVKNMLTTGECA